MSLNVASVNANAVTVANDVSVGGNLIITSSVTCDDVSATTVRTAGDAIVSGLVVGAGGTDKVKVKDGLTLYAGTGKQWTLSVDASTASLDFADASGTKCMTLSSLGTAVPGKPWGLFTLDASQFPTDKQIAGSGGAWTGRWKPQMPYSNALGWIFPSGSVTCDVPGLYALDMSVTFQCASAGTVLVRIARWASNGVHIANSDEHIFQVVTTGSLSHTLHCTLVAEIANGGDRFRTDIVNNTPGVLTLADPPTASRLVVTKIY